MKITFRTILYIISFGLLIYLLFLSFLNIDIAATKNDHLIQFEKVSLDKIQNIDSVRTKAKHYLDQRRLSQKLNSKESVKAFWTIIVLLLVQTMILLTIKRTDNNGR